MIDYMRFYNDLFWLNLQFTTSRYSVNSTSTDDDEEDTRYTDSDVDSSCLKLPPVNSAARSALGSKRFSSKEQQLIYRDDSNAKGS